MIFLNEDKANKKRFVTNKVLPYKGKMSNTLLVIEDVIDMSKKNPDNHRCICKCLACGRVYPHIIAVRDIRTKAARCFCSGQHKRYKFLDKRGIMLKFLHEERNRAKHEAVFASDMQRIIYFDMIINFLNSASLTNYFQKKLDTVW